MHIRTPLRALLAGATAAAGLASAAAAQRPLPSSLADEPAAAPTAIAPVAPAPADGAPRTRGVYRIVATGFQVLHETYDDPLQLDGKRDEVYLSSEVIQVNKAQTSVVPVNQIVRTSVLGDVAGQNGRVRAGTASALGGLRTGDSYPSLTPWTVNTKAAVGGLPIELWRGELVQGENAVLVTPTLWEFDQRDLREAYRSWGEWMGQATQTLQGSKEFQALVGLAFGPQAPMVVSAMAIGAPLGLSLMDDVIGRAGDRPIGMVPTPADGGKTRFTYNPQIVMLTFDAVERALATQVGGRGPGVISLAFPEQHPKLNGNYTLYLVIQRVQ